MSMSRAILFLKVKDKSGSRPIVDKDVGETVMMNPGDIKLNEKQVLTACTLSRLYKSSKPVKQRKHPGRKDG